MMQNKRKYASSGWRFYLLLPIIVMSITLTGCQTKNANQADETDPNKGARGQSNRSNYEETAVNSRNIHDNKDLILNNSSNQEENVNDADNAIEAEPDKTQGSVDKALSNSE